MSSTSCPTVSAETVATSALIAALAAALSVGAVLESVPHAATAAHVQLSLAASITNHQERERTDLCRSDRDGVCVVEGTSPRGPACFEPTAACLVHLTHPDRWPIGDHDASRPARLRDVTVLVPTRTSLPYLRQALDEAGLAQLMQRSAAITTEFENVPAAALVTLGAHRPVAPGADAVAICQDRALEKAHFRRCGVPCAAHALIESEAQLAAVDAALLPGMTIVVSPLLALVRDQLGHLNNRFDLPAASINSRDHGLTLHPKARVTVDPRGNVNRWETDRPQFPVPAVDAPCFAQMRPGQYLPADTAIARRDAAMLCAMAGKRLPTSPPYKALSLRMAQTHSKKPHISLIAQSIPSSRL